MPIFSLARLTADAWGRCPRPSFREGSRPGYLAPAPNAHRSRVRAGGRRGIDLRRPQADAFELAARACESRVLVLCSRRRLLREPRVLRARGWHRLFPPDQCPDQARCLASVGAAAASGAVLPFRLDYVIKVGTLRRLGGISVGLEAIVLSIVSLGMIDSVAMLPLSISATATSNSSASRPAADRRHLRVGCCALFFASRRLMRLPLLRRSRRLRIAAEHVPRHKTRPAGADATVAWCYLFACWTSARVRERRSAECARLSFSPKVALAVLCLSAAAAVYPDHGGRRSRQCGRNCRHPARARRRQGHRDQLLARLGPTARDERRRRRVCGILASVTMRLLARRGARVQLRLS